MRRTLPAQRGVRRCHLPRGVSVVALLVALVAGFFLFMAGYWCYQRISKWIIARRSSQPKSRNYDDNAALEAVADFVTGVRRDLMPYGEEFEKDASGRLKWPKTCAELTGQLEYTGDRDDVVPKLGILIQALYLRGKYFKNPRQVQTVLGNVQITLSNSENNPLTSEDPE